MEQHRYYAQIIQVIFEPGFSVPSDLFSTSITTTKDTYTSDYASYRGNDQFAWYDNEQLFHIDPCMCSNATHEELCQLYPEQSPITFADILSNQKIDDPQITQILSQSAHFITVKINRTSSADPHNKIVKETTVGQFFLSSHDRVGLQIHHIYNEHKHHVGRCILLFFPMLPQVLVPLPPFQQPESKRFRFVTDDDTKKYEQRCNILKTFVSLLFRSTYNDDDIHALNHNTDFTQLVLQLNDPDMIAMFIAQLTPFQYQYFLELVSAANHPISMSLGKDSKRKENEVAKITGELSHGLDLNPPYIVHPSFAPVFLTLLLACFQRSFQQRNITSVYHLLQISSNFSYSATSLSELKAQSHNKDVNASNTPDPSTLGKRTKFLCNFYSLVKYHTHQKSTLWNFIYLEAVKYCDSLYLNAPQSTTSTTNTTTTTTNGLVVGNNKESKGSNDGDIFPPNSQRFKRQFWSRRLAHISKVVHRQSVIDLNMKREEQARLPHSDVCPYQRLYMQFSSKHNKNLNNAPQLTAPMNSLPMTPTTALSAPAFSVLQSPTVGIPSNARSGTGIPRGRSTSLLDPNNAEQTPVSLLGDDLDDETPSFIQNLQYRIASYQTSLHGSKHQPRSPCPDKTLSQRYEELLAQHPREQDIVLLTQLIMCTILSTTDCNTEVVKAFILGLGLSKSLKSIVDAWWESQSVLIETYMPERGVYKQLPETSDARWTHCRAMDNPDLEIPTSLYPRPGTGGFTDFWVQRSSTATTTLTTNSHSLFSNAFSNSSTVASPTSHHIPSDNRQIWGKDTPRHFPVHVSVVPPMEWAHYNEYTSNHHLAMTRTHSSSHPEQNNTVPTHLPTLMEREPGRLLITNTPSPIIPNRNVNNINSISIIPTPLSTVNLQTANTTSSAESYVNILTPHDDHGNSYVDVPDAGSVDGTIDSRCTISAPPPPEDAPDLSYDGSSIFDSDLDEDEDDHTSFGEDHFHSENDDFEKPDDLLRGTPKSLDNRHRSNTNDNHDVTSPPVSHFSANNPPQSQINANGVDDQSDEDFIVQPRPLAHLSIHLSQSTSEHTNSLSMGDFNIALAVVGSSGPPPTPSRPSIYNTGGSGATTPRRPAPAIPSRDPLRPSIQPHSGLASATNKHGLDEPTPGLTRLTKKTKKTSTAHNDPVYTQITQRRIAETQSLYNNELRSPLLEPEMLSADSFSTTRPRGVHRSRPPHSMMLQSTTRNNMSLSDQAAQDLIAEQQQALHMSNGMTRIPCEMMHGETALMELEVSCLDMPSLLHYATRRKKKKVEEKNDGELQKIESSAASQQLHPPSLQNNISASHQQQSQLSSQLLSQIPVGTPLQPQSHMSFSQLSSNTAMRPVPTDPVMQSMSISTVGVLPLDSNNSNSQQPPLPESPTSSPHITPTLKPLPTSGIDSPPMSPLASTNNAQLFFPKIPVSHVDNMHVSFSVGPGQGAHAAYPHDVNMPKSISQTQDPHTDDPDLEITVSSLLRILTDPVSRGKLTLTNYRIIYSPYVYVSTPTSGPTPTSCSANNRNPSISVQSTAQLCTGARRTSGYQHPGMAQMFTEWYEPSESVSCCEPNCSRCIETRCRRVFGTIPLQCIHRLEEVPATEPSREFQQSIFEQFRLIDQSARFSSASPEAQQQMMRSMSIVSALPADNHSNTQRNAGLTIQTANMQKLTTNNNASASDPPTSVRRPPPPPPTQGITPNASSHLVQPTVPILTSVADHHELTTTTTGFTDSTPVTHDILFRLLTQWLMLPTNASNYSHLTQYDENGEPTTVGAEALLHIRCKDSRQVTFAIKNASPGKTPAQMWQKFTSTLRRTAYPKKWDAPRTNNNGTYVAELARRVQHIAPAKFSHFSQFFSLYAFILASNKTQAGQNGWDVYDILGEFKRQGVFETNDFHVYNNTEYDLCETYPPWLVFQWRTRTKTSNSNSKITEKEEKELLRNIIPNSAKYRSKGRLPAVTYYHATTGATLLRSAQPMSGITNRTSKEDADLCNRANISTIYDARPKKNARANQVKGGGYEPKPELYNSQLIYCNIDNIHDMRKALKQIATICRDACPHVLMANSQLAGIVHASMIFQHASRIVQISEHHQLQQEAQLQAGPEHSISVNPSRTHSLTNSSIASLTRQPGFSTATDLIARCGIKTLPERYGSLLSSDWANHVSGLLRNSVLIAQGLLEGRSSLVRCSDGWDRTSQLASLAQIMVDPYFRTIQGFAVLLEKDWLSFGHKFSDRCGHAGSDYNSEERSPIFTQFLDAVFQLMDQFPEAFEFDDNLLHYLGTHVYSCKYGTFLFNSDRERHHIVQAQLRTVSIWDVVVYSHKSKFTNPRYDSEKYRAIEHVSPTSNLGGGKCDPSLTNIAKNSAILWEDRNWVPWPFFFRWDLRTTFEFQR